MKLRRALHVMGSGALTGALLLGTATAANADEIRDRQWAHKFFAVEDIWKKSTGKDVTVAVVDSGVDPSMPDLTGQVLPGKDFSQKGGNPHKDINGHGTAMAGIIAGHGHGAGRSSGVMGLAPDSKILPVKVDKGGSGYGVSLSEGIRYAVDQGAKVINVSLAGSFFNEKERQAISYAQKRDVIVVGGMGNDGARTKKYPAAYPGVVAVGGLDRDGSVWEGSNSGPHTTLIAPATQNVVADPAAASGYSVARGTSDATAYVSAAAALVRAKHPDLTAGQVINRLVKTALPVAAKGEKPKLPDEKYGYGVVRPFRAVTYDIPAGPKAGPLEQSSGSETSTASGSAAGDSSSEGSNFWLSVLTYPVVWIGVIFLALVGIVVVVVTKKKRGGGPGGGNGPGGGVSPMSPPPGAQQQSQAPVGQFGGPPNQPLQ